MITEKCCAIINWTLAMCACKLRWTEKAQITFGKIRMTYKLILNIFYTWGLSR